MPEGWSWDETLFAGSAAFYSRGRLPYPAGLAPAFAGAADLGGAPRLIDVGCGPGTVALRLAPLFAEVVGVDADAGMVAEAARLADEAGVANARWARLRAEELPAGLGRFRYATFAQSFHWMDRDLVARAVYEMLEPGGAFVHVGTAGGDGPRPDGPLPHPPPPLDEMRRLRERRLGPVRRAGQGYLRHGTPGDEWGVLRRAGYQAPVSVPVPGGELVVRTADDVVANVFSSSATAPHLFGAEVDDFERELREVLDAASPTGLFSERIGDVQLVFYGRPR